MLADINELVVRYVDGALSSEEALAFEILFDANPELHALIEEHRRLRSMLLDAYGPPPCESDLGAIRAMLTVESEREDSAVAPQFAFARARQVIKPVLLDHRFAWCSGIAASLVLGIAIGQMTGGKADRRLLDERNGQLTAAGQLDAALTGQLSGPRADGGVQIGLSFRTASGLCRTFTIQAGLAGLACHHAGTWSIEATARQSPPSHDSTYRLAASSVPAGIMAQVDDTIIGEPLSETEELRARRNGW